MKKIILTFLILLVYVVSLKVVFAGGVDYSFSLDYEGGIVAGVQKSGTVTLQGVDSPVQNNVRIRVDITGPASPTILATDSNGTELDIASLGYWGPETGFTVGGTFTNVTPIKATFPVEGSYEVALTLIDVNSPNTEYARDIFVIAVAGANAGDTSQDNTQDNIQNNTPSGDLNSGLTDGNEELNEITKLPQTGNYNIIYISFAIVAIIIVIVILYSRKNKES